MTIDVGRVQMRHVLMAFVPIPFAFALAMVGLAIGQPNLIYLSIAVSAIAMPLGGYAAARLFHQLADEVVEPSAGASRRPAG